MTPDTRRHRELPEFGHPDFSPLQAIPHEFYERDTVEVCRDLIGAYLVHVSEEGETAGRIVEAEAYCGPEDRGAHSRGGKPTVRTRAMYGPRGHAYIFLIYGAHWCFNIVTGTPPMPQAVLIRALEPAAGLDLMRARVAARPGTADSKLCQGPGKLCRALGITGALYGENLTGETLYLVPGGLRPGERVAASPRINIDYAGEWAARPWRFYIPGHPAVSGPKALRGEKR